MVDIEAEKKILKEFSVMLRMDHTADIDEGMKYIAEDAFLFPPNGPAIMGSKAIMEVAKMMVQTEVITMGDRTRPPTHIEVAASGDLAYDYGRFRIVTQGPDGPVEEKGHYITVYKKIDGQWKFAGQSWSNIRA